MMSGKRTLLDALAVLYTYPGGGPVEYGPGGGQAGDFAERVANCRALADERSPGRGDALASLEERARGMSQGEIEEMFTRTFEINPVCALEVGWHVYGEEYARGALMVRLRQELRRQGIPEISELPDHLLHVLQLLGRLETELADDLAGRYVLPALGKMIDAVDGKDCPYLGLLEMTRDVVRDEFDAIEIEPKERRKAPPGSKPRLPILQTPRTPGCGNGGKPASCATPGSTRWEAEHGA